MAKAKCRVVAYIRGRSRDLLLRMVPPRLENVFCHGVQHAYKVAEDYDFRKKDLEVRVIGVHRTCAHEALVCTVDGQTHRPDGKPYHITLSTATGVPPAQAAEIDLSRMEPINPIVLQLRFELDRLWVSKPMRLEAQRLAA